MPKAPRWFEELLEGTQVPRSDELPDLMEAESARWVEKAVPFREVAEADALSPHRAPRNFNPRENAQGPRGSTSRPAATRTNPSVGAVPAQWDCTCLPRVRT